MFPFKKYRCGQSSLELLGVMVFVMMAIIIGGPYVVRSINSYFKSIEEGALDSEREKITEGPTTVSLPTCDCTPVPLCGDGSTVIDGMVCSKQKRIYNKFSCSPAGCDVTLMARDVIPPLRCGDDLTNTCCGDPTYSLCANDPGAIGWCVYGEREEQKWCGSPIPIVDYDCRPDALCRYTCDTKDVNAVWCQPDATLREAGLPSTRYPVKYQDNSVGCLGATYCEAVCAAGYTVIPGGCKAPPPPPPPLPRLEGCGCGACPAGASPDIPAGDGDWTNHCLAPAGYSFGDEACSLADRYGGVWWPGTPHCYGSHVGSICWKMYPPGDNWCARANCGNSICDIVQECTLCPGDCSITGARCNDCPYGYYVSDGSFAAKGVYCIAVDGTLVRCADSAITDIDGAIIGFNGEIPWALKNWICR